jgi:hypothetical protein
MAGAPFASAGEQWRAWGAPIPPAIDPGRAEQTRLMASRSFVQWRAPPGRHEPRPLHGVWADGRRDGSRGERWVEVRGWPWPGFEPGFPHRGEPAYDVLGR